VAGVCIPVVVDGVDNGSVVDLGRAAGGVADVITLERDLVVLASEIESLGSRLAFYGVLDRGAATYPVVVTIAGGGPVCIAVDVAVGDGNAGVGIISAHHVLTTNEGSLHDPVSEGFADHL
jgi:hypothetical protein